jgi:hypothetical protein
MTYTLIPSLELKSTKSSVHSLTPSEKVDLALKQLCISNLNLSEPLWIAWHMPSSWLAEQIQGSMKMESLLSFYHDNYVDTLP